VSRRNKLEYKTQAAANLSGPQLGVVLDLVIGWLSVSCVGLGHALGLLDVRPLPHVLGKQINIIVRLVRHVAPDLEQ